MPPDETPPSFGRFRFPRWVNYLLPLLVLGAVGGATYLPVLVGFGFSAKTLNVGYQPAQPVPYSHKLHVGKLGMDCRYCHTTVDRAAEAAIPNTQICINCHNPDQNEMGVRKTSQALKPIHQSYRTGEPVKWVKVHDLADYVYFSHEAHVNKGVSCVECHGRVDKMQEVYQVKPLSMSWCLDCHREPTEHLRPKDQVTNLAWDPRDTSLARAKGVQDRERAQQMVGEKLKKEYHIHDEAYMTSCSTCHR